MLKVNPEITFYKRLLTGAYTDWLACGADLNLGRRKKISKLATIETRCKKYAKKLRVLGGNTPPVPGEPGFK